MDTSKLKGLWEKIKDFFKNMSKKVRIILAASLAVILIAIIAVVVIFSGKEPYTVLYQDLTPTEVSEIISYFENNEITDYRITGNAISVRNEQYHVLLAKLAQAGYPKDGTLYGSYYEHAGTMSTSAERATAYLLAQQEALATTIRTMDGVLNATVYIAPGEERTYVLEDVNTATTAAVHLELKKGYILTDEQAQGIRWLVSHAWSGLSIDDVSITDGVGNTYSDIGANASDAAELQRQLEESNANRLRTQIKLLLDPLYGEENVSVAASVSVEVNRHVSESTTYQQPAGSYESGGLIGHELGQFVLTRDGYELAGGIPGTSTNSDIPLYVQNEADNVQPGDGVQTYYEKDNKIDTTTEQIEYLAPRITSVGISVTINSNANSAADINTGDLRTHIATAANIGGDNPESRVSVLVAPFPTPPQEDVPVSTGFFTPERMPLLIIAAVALLLVIIILIVVLSIRRKKREQEEEDQRIIEEQLSQMGSDGLLGELGVVPPVPGAEGEAAPPTSGADIMDINTEKSMELRKAVRQFVQNNPEVAAMMLKNWLKGDDDNG